MIPGYFEFPLALRRDGFGTADLRHKEHVSRPPPDFLTRGWVDDRKVITLTAGECEWKEFIRDILDGQNEFMPVRHFTGIEQE